MEDLVRSLRSLGLKPPSNSLLVDLLESDGDPAAQKRLADLLALEKLNDDEDDEDEDIFITPDVVRGALLSLLDSFSRTLNRSRELHKREYAALCQQQQQQSQDRKKKLLKPVPRAALLNRQSSDIRRAQEEWEASLGRTTNDKGKACRPLPLPRLILDGAPYFTSTTALDRLERTAIADFEAPFHFKGRYLLCRVISAPLIYVGATFIVDDPAGLAIPLSIAHFTPHLNLSPSSPALLNLLPRGTILSVREPYVSNNHHLSAGGPILGKAAAGVRVSSPSDIIVLEQDDTTLKDVQWKIPLEAGDGDQVKGHEWMREGHCTRAVLSKSDRPGQLPSNKSTSTHISALVEQHRPGAAYRELMAARQLGILSDLGKVGSSDDQDVVNLEARILHDLRAYDALRQLAIRCDQHGLTLPSAQKSILEEQSLYRSERSSASQQTRLSSVASKLVPTDSLIKQLYALDRTATALTPNPELYGQDYVSSALTIQSIPGAGRGLVTSRDVQPGELLLCCRAVEPCFAEDDRWAGVQILRLGLNVGGEDGGDPGAEGVSVTTTQVMACTCLVHAIADRPELRHAVLGLTAGPHLPYSAFAKEEKYPLLTDAALDPSVALGQYQQPDVDAKYVDGVLQHNAFGPGRDVDVEGLNGHELDLDGNHTGSSPRVAPARADLARASMPHPLPAILNHRCIPNVSSVFLGPIILTRALIPLARNTEIVHQYVSGERPFSIRNAQLSKHGFECGCVLCELERGEGKELVRKRVEVKEGKMGAVLERARMLFKNKKAGLVGSSGQSEGREEEEEAEEDLARAFEGLAEEIEGTYGINRTPWSKTDQVVLKPELFDPFVMLARHWRGRPQGWWRSVQYEIKALRSVGAIINPSWLGSMEDAPLRLPATTGNHVILVQAPVLRLVDGQRSMLRIARTIYAQQQPGAGMAAEQWVHASYTLSRYMIGGGLSVYLDMMRRARLSDEWELQDNASDKLRQESGMVAEDVVLDKWQADAGGHNALDTLAIQ